jgi:hypothetical protein
MIFHPTIHLEAHAASKTISNSTAKPASRLTANHRSAQPIFAGPQILMDHGLGVVMETGDQTDWGRVRANDDREIDDAEGA